MASTLNTLLSSIRDCKDHESVQTLLSEVKAKQASATAPDVIRALRDAQVYALIWNVYVVVTEKEKQAAKSRDIYKSLEIAIENGDDAAIQAFEARSSAPTEAPSERVKDPISEALGAVQHDANNDGTDAFADAAAADMAASDIQQQLINLGIVTPTAQRSRSRFDEPIDSNPMAKAIISSVQEAYAYYETASVR